MCHSGSYAVLAATVQPRCGVEGVQVQVLGLTSQCWKKKEANRNHPPHKVADLLFILSFILFF